VWVVACFTRFAHFASHHPRSNNQSSTLKIDVDQLEQALKTLVDELRKKKGKIINIEQPIDYYWSIAGNDLYNPYENPTELTLGQLSDDLEEMNRIASKKSEPVSYDFVKMSSVMAMLGHKTVW